MASVSGSAMNIRGAIPEDREAMADLERESPTAAHWAESFYIGFFEEGAADRVSLVAEDEDEVRGFLVARVAGDECELENIVVAEGNRRFGLGSKLIQALIEAVCDRRGNRIFLEVRESNATARSFYETCGFAVAGRRKSYYKDPEEDAVLYSLALPV
jgi:ribosomal-protein-alanine acetyltransferase